MPKSKVNRLVELNRLWLKLNIPKPGDKVKFRFANSEIFDGEIININTGKSTRLDYTILTNDSRAVGDRADLVITECNGVKFEPEEAKKITNKEV